MVAGSPCSMLPSSRGSINSVQNGMLLDDTIHALFDNCNGSINLDDNYKIVCFEGDGLSVGGRYLDQAFGCCGGIVLMNMRGAGEPVLETARI